MNSNCETIIQRVGAEIDFKAWRSVANEVADKLWYETCGSHPFADSAIDAIEAPVQAVVEDIDAAILNKLDGYFN